MNWLKHVFIVIFIAVSPQLFSADAKHQDEQNDYQFLGRHMIAQYYDCNPEALRNVKKLAQVMNQAAKASGAHILKECEYVFPPDGLTMVLLLSESHASIHTYPEHRACFVDLFTCGTNCSAEKFDQVIREYLKPKEVDCKIIERK